MKIAILGQIHEDGLNLLESENFEITTTNPIRIDSL